MLHPPFRALRTSTTGNIMEEVICPAGLENKGYSAESFLPTSATAAIDSGENPDIVMKTGRWETASVFRDHSLATVNRSYLQCFVPRATVRAIQELSI